MLKRLVGLSSLLLLGWASTVSAGPIAVDAGWYGFCFEGVGSPATAGCQNDATAGVTGNQITFASAGSVLLKVTDAFQYGDIFSLVIDAALPVLTSLVAVDASGVTTDPDLAFADLGYSKYSTVLGPGAHTLDIFVDTSPFGGGGAYVEVESVPEPATLLLFGMGSFGLLSLRRRSNAA